MTKVAFTSPTRVICFWMKRQSVLPERGERLNETDEDDLLTTEEAADRLGIDLD